MLNNAYDPQEGTSQKFRRFIKYLTYFWALRLAMLAGGGLISSLLEFLMPAVLKFSGANINNSTVLIMDVSSTSWRRVVADDFRPLLAAIKHSHEPSIFRNVPVAETESLVQSVLSISLPLNEITVKLSDDWLFEHHDAGRAWAQLPSRNASSAAASAGRVTTHQTMSMSEYLTLPMELTSYMSYLHAARDKLHQEQRYAPAATERFRGKKRRGFVGLASPAEPSNSKSQLEQAHSDAIGQCSAINSSTSAEDGVAVGTSCNAGSEEMNGMGSWDWEYMYSTYPRAAALVSPLAPGLSQFLSILPLHLQPQQCLWLSDEKVTAAMHYDMEDNLLLQVAGKKTVTIASPELVLYAHSFPSSHPLWRQTQFSSALTSLPKVKRFVENSALEPLSNTKQHKWQEEKRQEQQRMDCEMLVKQELIIAEAQQRTPIIPAICKAKTISDLDSLPMRNPAQRTQPQLQPPQSAQQHGRSGGGAGETSSAPVRLWEVELQAGDMIYIPAGYYHTVQAQTSSVSINAWFTSQLSSLFNRLMEQPFIFKPRAPINVKLCQLSVLLHHVIKNTKLSAVNFIRIVLHRYQSQRIDDADAAAEYSKYGASELEAAKNCSALCLSRASQQQVPLPQVREMDEMAMLINQAYSELLASSGDAAAMSMSAASSSSSSTSSSNDSSSSVGFLVLVAFIEYLEEVLNIIVQSEGGEVAEAPWKIFHSFFNDCAAQRVMQ